MPAPLPNGVYRRRRLVVALVAAGLVSLLVAGISRLATTPSLADEPTGLPAGRLSTERVPASPAPSTTTTTPTGRFTTAPGGSPVVGSGPTYRYRVEVEQGTGVDPATFARAVDQILGDPRGWITADALSLERVADGSAQFLVRLTTPATTDRLCQPLDTQGQVSCGQNAMAVINLTRWQVGADPPRLDRANYRAYVILHEFGHLLGHDHVGCPGSGQPAPTMMQQTYSIGACSPNPWPVPDA